MSGSWMCVQGSTAKPSSTRLRRSHTPCALAMGEMPVIGKKRGTEEGPSYKSPEELALKLGPQPPPQSTSPGNHYSTFFSKNLTTLSTSNKRFIFLLKKGLLQISV